MERRRFLASVAGAAGRLTYGVPSLRAAERGEGRTFASPAEAAKSPPEKLAYVVALHAGTEVKKPDILAKRGGLWLRSGPVEIHLGVEADFRPARKAHPAVRVSDLDGLAERLAAAGYEPKWDTDLPHIRRFHVSDPVGNRLEIIEEANQAGHA